MVIEEFRDLLVKEKFQPFVIKTRDGRAYPMFGVKPPGPAASARENALFFRPFARGGPLPARKV
jgi:hypothetical protein